MSAILEVQDLVKRFDGLLASDHLSLAVEEGEIHAVIGPNGAGKTTLINQLTGELAADSGRIRVAGEDVTGRPVAERARRGLARSYQISQVFRELSVRQNVLIAAQARMKHCFRFWRPAADDGELGEAASHALERVGLRGKDAISVSALAHGEVRQLELAMALVTDPKVLLLDEPMAGMSQAESERIVALLRSLKGRYSILLVEHDMDAIFALADRITVLVGGRAIASGSVETIRSDPAVRDAYLGDE
jgi:branched-chain amino acid transport system ATP-binding protein